MQSMKQNMRGKKPEKANKLTNICILHVTMITVLYFSLKQINE